MQPAAEVMAQALAQSTINPSVVPIVSNVSARPVRDPNDIVRSLVSQVTGTVRWRESVEWMAGSGVTDFYEIGAGKVLSGLVRRIAEGSRGFAVGTADDIRSFKATGVGRAPQPSS
jgi:[acyl-carrier-protein] S-malonyltransferase